MTPLNPEGTSVWPLSFTPHATTRPSVFNATLCRTPAAIATTPVNPLGTVACPDQCPPGNESRLLPQPTTVPSLLNAKLCRFPAAIETALSSPEGVEAAP